MVSRSLLPVKAFVFLEIFPFCVVFDEGLVITNIGNSLQAVMPTVVGKRIPEVFDLAKPLVECSWKSVSIYKCMFISATMPNVARLGRRAALQGSR